MQQAEAELLYAQILQWTPAGRGGIMQAQMHPLLSDLQQRLDMQCIQTFRSDVLDLQQNSINCIGALQGNYAWCALLPLKNRQQMLAAVAEAWAHVETNGQLIIVASNRGGAKSLHKQLTQLGTVTHVSRAKCRLMVVHKCGIPDILQQWRDAAAPQRAERHGLWTRPGLFSWDRLDAGSVLLLQQLPESLCGEGLDLCCGYGALAVPLMQKMPGITCLHVLDAEYQALEMAERNLAPWQDRIRLHWQDAAREVLPKKMDWIVCNPPFHRGLQRQTALGQKIVAQACRSLKTGGQLWLVANRQLPYEQVMHEYCEYYEVLVQRHGFKVLYGVGR